MTAGNLWAVCRERGITLRSGQDHSPAASRSRTTYARGTIRRLMDKHGEAHVCRTLDAILGDRKGEPRNREGNACELYGCTIAAVAELLARHPSLAEGDVAGLLRDVDLGALRRKAQAINAGATWQVMLALLSLAFVETGSDDNWLREAA